MLAQLQGRLGRMVPEINDPDLQEGGVGRIVLVSGGKYGRLPIQCHDYLTFLVCALPLRNRKLHACLNPTRGKSVHADTEPSIR